MRNSKCSPTWHPYRPKGCQRCIELLHAKQWIQAFLELACLMLKADRLIYMYKRTQIQTSFWLALQESCLQHFIWIHEMTVEDHWERNREVSVAQTVNFGFYHSEFLLAGWRENSRVLKFFPRQNNGMSRKTLELNEDKLPKVHWHWWYQTLSL